MAKQINRSYKNTRKTQSRRDASRNQELALDTIKNVTDKQSLTTRSYYEYLKQQQDQQKKE